MIVGQLGRDDRRQSERERRGMEAGESRGEGGRDEGEVLRMLETGWRRVEGWDVQRV